jgi:hypothetical protein
MRLASGRANSISGSRFVDASFRCWKEHVPFGVYNMTNPGSITTREVVDLIRKSGMCQGLK